MSWTVITTIASSGSGGQIYDEVFAFHDALAKKYGGAPAPALPWWRALNPPFQCKAGAGCRVWRLPVDANITQAVAETKPEMILGDGRTMTVSDVWMPMGDLPGWFVVFKTATHKLVCLADECEQIK